jgi:predicted nucleotidyltransferase
MTALHSAGAKSLQIETATLLLVSVLMHDLIRKVCNFSGSCSSPAAGGTFQPSGLYTTRLRGCQREAEGATALYLFGSVARDQAHAMSDIDVFVDYDPNSTFSLLNMSGIRLIIMDEIGRDVDITTSSSLHPRLRDRILAEAVRIL